MKRKHRYLLHVWDDVEPRLLGPFTTEDAQAKAAHDVRRGDGGGIYPLDLTIHYEREDHCISYDLDVSTYSGAFFDDEADACDTCGAPPGEPHPSSCAIQMAIDSADEVTTVTMTLTESLDAIASVIRKLDALPSDHEPDADDLWEALRQIEELAGEGE